MQDPVQWKQCSLQCFVICGTSISKTPKKGGWWWGCFAKLAIAPVSIISPALFSVCQISKTNSRQSLVSAPISMFVKMCLPLNNRQFALGLITILVPFTIPDIAFSSPFLRRQDNGSLAIQPEQIAWSDIRLYYSQALPLLQINSPSLAHLTG